MNRTEHQIIRFLTLHPDGLTASALKSLLRPAVSQPTLWRRLEKLRAEGHVRKEGKSRATRYRLQGSDHLIIDLRSRAMHQAIGRKLVQQPGLLDSARANLKKMAGSNPYAKPYLDRWAVLLAGPLNGVLEVLGANTEDAIALRHVSPFAGFLSEAERLAVLREHGLYQ